MNDAPPRKKRRLSPTARALTPGRRNNDALRRFDSGDGPTDAELRLSERRGLTAWKRKQTR